MFADKLATVLLCTQTEMIIFLRWNRALCYLLLKIDEVTLKRCVKRKGKLILTIFLFRFCYQFVNNPDKYGKRLFTERKKNKEIFMLCFMIFIIDYPLNSLFRKLTSSGR